MIPNIEHDMSRIVQYTYSVAGYRKCKDIFDGVVSISDFARFVYFEYCAIRYINSEEQHSVHSYLSQQHKQSFDAYQAEERNKAEGSKDVIIPYSYEWLYSKDYTSFSRSVLRYIEEMIETRQIPKCESAAKALQDLMNYEGNTREKRLAGTPIGQTFFYQALCECICKVKGTNKYEWLAQKRTSTNAIATFYADIDRFINNFMLAEYSTRFTDKERREYISKAINLVKFADRRKLDLIYDFATHMEEMCPDYFAHTEKDNSSNPNITRYRFSDLPPVFFDTITVLPWEADLFVTECIASILGQDQKIYQSVSFSLAAPYMCYDRYLEFFLRESTTSCKIEASRYYMIKLLAERVKKALWEGKLNIEYSEKNFAAFIKSYYNVFELYKRKQDDRSRNPLNKKQANLIREISRRLYPEHST